MPGKKQLADAFATYGKSPSDAVTLVELTAVLTRTTSSGAQMSSENAKRLFAAADTAACGFVPCEFFTAMWTKEPLDRALLLQGTFDMADFDQSGKLSCEEFSALSKDQDPASVAMQKSVFDKAASLDGDPSRLGLSEFVHLNMETGADLSDTQFAAQVSAWLKLAMLRTKIDRAAMLSATFHWCDVNASGVLEKKEFTNLSLAQDSRSVAMQEAVFAMADTNADGLLQEEEFVKFNLETGKALGDFDFAQQLRGWTKLAKLRA